MSSDDIRRVLFKHHTRAYGVVLVLGAQPLDAEAVHVLLDHLLRAPNWDGFNASRQLQAVVAQRMLEQAGADEEAIRPPPREKASDLSLHTQIQFYLAQLGHALHFPVWIPKADQGREYHGTRLEEISRAELPPLPFSESALRIIRNIDVIWLYEDSPVYLFEVEHTTTVYSGLLRMSDLIALIPALNIGMFIVAPAERKPKVIAEVNRPTFARRAIPLAERCRFIAFERLADFMQGQSDYLKHFSVSILDELSEALGPGAAVGE
jgi:hypothetical protein